MGTLNTTPTDQPPVVLRLDAVGKRFGSVQALSDVSFNVYAGEVLLPGQPVVTYGGTMDGALTINLRVAILISDAAPAEKVQRALDAYLGIGSGTTLSSIPAALQADPTLGGVVHFAEAISAGNYGRLEWAGVTYFGARIEVQVGSI